MPYFAWVGPLFRSARSSTMLKINVAAGQRSSWYRSAKRSAPAPKATTTCGARLPYFLRIRECSSSSSSPSANCQVPRSSDRTSTRERRLRQGSRGSRLGGMNARRASRGRPFRRRRWREAARRNCAGSALARAGQLRELRFRPQQGWPAQDRGRGRNPANQGTPNDLRGEHRGASLASERTIRRERIVSGPHPKWLGAARLQPRASSARGVSTAPISGERSLLPSPGPG